MNKFDEMKPPMEIGQTWSNEHDRYVVTGKAHGTWWYVRREDDGRQISWDEERVMRHHDPRHIVSAKHPLMEGECL